MAVLSAVSQILMMFLLAAVGLGLRKTGRMDDDLIAKINRLLLLVAQPALMLVATQREHSADQATSYLLAIALTTAMLWAVMLLVYALFRRQDHRTRPVLAVAAALPNVGYMGIPVAQAIYGDAGALYLSAFIIGFNMAQWTVGAALYSGMSLKSLKNMLNPPFVFALLGMTLFVTKIAIPEVLLNTCQQLSYLNTPLSLMILGARMETLRPKHLADGRMWVVVAVKMLLFPLAALALLRALHLPEVLLGVLVLGCAMPSGANIQVQAEYCGADGGLAARCISVTTLLSIVTIPFILLVMG